MEVLRFYRKDLTPHALIILPEFRFNIHEY